MLSKSTEYAIRALIYISASNQQGKKPGYKAIASEIGGPDQFVAKILQAMVHRGILQAGRGRGGGFSFLPEAREITLHDLIMMLDGEKKWYGCGIGLERCSAENPCPFHQNYAPVREQILDMLRSTSILGLSESVMEGRTKLSSVLPMLSVQE